MTTLQVRGLTKRFGDLCAVDGVTFDVAAGQICGFIGPNGAGKTTTMRICSTLELPDAGDVLLDGVSVVDEPRASRAQLGFMPDSYGTYAHTVIWEYLDFYARAYGLRGDRRRRTIGEVMEFTGLAQIPDKPIASLSKGMKQRLCLAKTLLHDPSLLILDEPAAGLDPRARVELRELVRALAQLGKAVLISSHILTELAEVCHTVVIIEQGRVRGQGSVDAIVKQLQPHAQVRLRALEPAEVVLRALAEEAHVRDARPEGDALSFTFEGGPEDLAGLLESLVKRGLRPVEFAPERVDLEDVFLSLTEGRVQ